MKHDYWNHETSEAFKYLYASPYGGVIYEPFEHIEPALRHGWNHALAAEYPNETWEEVEEDLERMWNESHKNHGPWSEFKIHVRHAWEKAREDWRSLASKAKST